MTVEWEGLTQAEQELCQVQICRLENCLKAIKYQQHSLCFFFFF